MSGRKLYIGGLPFSTSEQDLQDLLSEHGTVDSVRIITDRFTGRSRGFGFVEMSNDAEAQAAIEALNGTQYGGRTLVVNEAKPRPEGGGGGRGEGGGFSPRGERRNRW